MSDEPQVRIENLDGIIEKLEKYPAALEEAIVDGATLGGDIILDTEGLRIYPTETDANLPPPPYYIRHIGPQISEGENLRNSEFLGDHFESKGELNSKGVAVHIGNVVSYAEHVIGEDQAQHMKKIGWRRLIDVATEKLDDFGKAMSVVLDSAAKKVGWR